MKDFHTIDDILHSVSTQYDIFKALNPKEVIEGKSPAYLYNEPGFDVEASREVLRNLRTDKRYLLGRLFEERRLYMLNILDLLDSIGKDAEMFTQASINNYGKPPEILVERSYKLLKELKPEPECPKTVSSERVKAEIEELLRARDYQGWTVEIVDNLVANIKVSPKHGLVSVKNANFSEKQLKKFKVHEILTHVRRAEGARKQPYKLFLSLPGYELTEEGLALVTEKEESVLSNASLKRCAGYVVAVSLSLEHSFDEVVQEMIKYFPEKQARQIAKRTKRGLKDTSRKGAFTKDYQYLKGMFDLEDYLASGGDKEILYNGKIGIEHVPVVEKLIEKGMINDVRGAK